MSILIGTTDAGAEMRLDVQRMIVSRVLITSSSGGGKSWLLRKILEEVSATTQTIVIDPDGEFASLREIRDMILVGPDGDLPADPSTAGLLCRRLMERNVSAVLDIFELAPSKRREFVAAFCTEMVNLPKSLWRNCVIALDEAHEFAPNNKDSRWVSREPVSLLFSKGRKRGFCPIIATQRLSKLSMDVAAETKTRFIGQTFLDVDQKRAADFLGWSKDRWTDLRDLSPPNWEGEFFGVGPALNERGVVKFRSGMVKSTHPSAGQGRASEPPAPSAKIRSVLAELKDLQQHTETQIAEPERKSARAAAPIPSRTNARSVVPTRAHTKPQQPTPPAAAENNPEEEDEMSKEDTQAILESIGKLTTAIMHDRPKGSRPPSPAPEVDDEEQPSAPAPLASIVNGDLQSIVAAVIDRIAASPKLIKLATTRPVIELEIETPTVVMDEKSNVGKIARLVADGFFKEAKGPTDAFKHLVQNRGYNAPSIRIYAACTEMLKMGFLRVVQSRPLKYQEVPTMLKNIKVKKDKE